MPTDQDPTSGYSVDQRPGQNGELKGRIRAELARQFGRPPSIMAVTAPLWDLSAVVDLDKLADLAAKISNERGLCFTLISKEYIRTGLNWINAMKRLGLENFFVISGDRLTSETLDQRGIPNIAGQIDEQSIDMSFVADDGFSSKGLAMIAFKFPVIKFLVEQGNNVMFSDADAVWLQDPLPHLPSADVAFQRIIYHPPSIASLWGFAACTGFVCFRQGSETIAFLDQCIEEHKQFHCDQVALNVALFEGDPAWRCEQIPWVPPSADAWTNQDQRRAVFGRLAQFPITGTLRRGDLKVLALPHDKFWRHAWVTRSLRDVVICHPNSPKDDLEKMKAFGAIGIRFPPETGSVFLAREQERGTR